VRDENGVAIFSFGKHRDKPVAEVFKREPSYYTWIMEGDFPAYTKEVCRKIYNESKLSQNPNIIFKR
jgi:DNA polymerase-3 subunit epsilon